MAENFRAPPAARRGVEAYKADIARWAAPNLTAWAIVKTSRKSGRPSAEAATNLWRVLMTVHQPQLLANRSQRRRLRQDLLGPDAGSGAGDLQFREQIG